MHPPNNHPLIVKTFVGEETKPYINALARLRIEVFREFPYLYDGNLSYEAHYLRKFTRTANSLIVGLFSGGELVGASTALPLVAETEDFCHPFRKLGYDPKEMFYFGESVIKKPHRGFGYGQIFFQRRLAFAQGLGFYKWASFCAVIRDPHDSRRPSTYRGPESLWKKNGFKKLADGTVSLSWKEIGEGHETPKDLAIWLRSLHG